jgi:hypothetical protein
MKKFSQAILFIALILVGLQSVAQTKLSIDKVYKVTLRNSGTIVENEQVKGYYFFYMSDKIDKKTNEYTLQILDENLNKIKDIKFQDEKDITLLESTFNGNSMGFLFWNDKENTLDFRLYGLDGKQSFTYSQVLDKKSEKYFEMLLEQNSKNEDSENQHIFDVPGKGFISVTPVRENKKYTYNVNYFASGKRKNWVYDPIEDGKFASAQYLGCNNEVAVIEVLKKDKLMSKNMESTLVGLNLETGRKVFEMRTEDGKYQLYPMNISTLKESNQFIMVGPYYDGTANVMQDKSQGLGIWVVNNQGKVVQSKYMSWEKDLGKFMNVDQKGRVSDLGYVYIHHIMQTEDGKVFVIGEGYKKVADGAGIALTVLQAAAGGYGGAGVTKLQITDLLMLQLSPNFDLTNAQLYQKNKNSFSLGSAGDFSSPHTLALIAKMAGAFDYTYTQMGKNNASFVSAYTDYERSKDYKGLTFHSISYYDGKLSTDKINLETKASKMGILPAKPGFVLIMEYFKKDKRLDLRMEKIN